MGTSQQKEQMRGDFSNHERLKNYKIIKGRNNKQFMEVSMSIHDTKLLHKWEHDIKSIKQKDCLFLPQSFQLIEEGRCGSSGTLKILFEYFPFSLQNQIANRVEFKSPFNQQELWFLLYEITSSVIEFQNVGKKSGDIRPKNIFINEDGLVKVITQFAFPDEKSNYMKALEDHQPAYLSPEELAQFEKGIVNPRADPVLSQAFSIGLTMLDAGLLLNSQELYEMRNLRFNLHKFHESLIKWKQSQYSPFLIRTVQNLLEINWYERPTAGEVRAVLEPYEEQIINLEAFVPSKQKSKAKLDIYQTGTTGSNKKTPQHYQHMQYNTPNNIPIIQPQFRPQSPPPMIPSSPVHQAINTVKIHSYPQHQIPMNSNISILQPPFNNHENIERNPRERFSSSEKFKGGHFKSYKIPPPSLQSPYQNPMTRRQIMIPAQPIRVIPNSRVYLQEDKYLSQIPKY